MYNKINPSDLLYYTLETIPQMRGMEHKISDFQHLRSTRPTRLTYKELLLVKYWLTVSLHPLPCKIQLIDYRSQAPPTRPLIALNIGVVVLASFKYPGVTPTPGHIDYV